MGVKERYEQNKKKTTGTSSSNASTSTGVRARYEQAQAQAQAQNEAQEKAEAQSAATESLKNEDLSDIYEALQKGGYIDTKTLEDYETRLNNYKNNLSAAGVSLGSKKESSSTLSGLDFTAKNSDDVTDDAINEIIDSVSSYKEYMSNFKDEDTYNQALANYEENEKKLSYDLEQGKNELDTLNNLYNDAKKYQTSTTTGLNISPYGDSQAKKNDLSNYLKSRGYDYTSLEDIKKDITEKETYYNQAKDLQEYTNKKAEYESIAENAKDYAEKVAEGIALMDKDETSNYWANALTSIGSPVRYDKTEESLKYLKDVGEKEYNTYAYIRATQGKDAADEYQSIIQNDLYNAQGKSIYNDIQGKTALEIAFGIVSGVDQFSTGATNAAAMLTDVFTGERATDSSALQYASQYVREDLADDGFEVLGNSLGQVAYDAITTTVNMLPTQGFNYVAPGTGSAFMGVTATGNYYQNLIQQGYSTAEAAKLSTILGIWETASESALGSIEGVGKGLLAKPIKNALGKVANGWLKAILDSGIDIMNEGMEEVIQGIGSNLIQGAITGKYDNDENLAYEFALGALSAAILNGASSVVTNVQYGTTASDIKSQKKIEELKKVGSTFSADTVANKLSSMLNDKSTVGQIAKALKAVNAELSDQNKTDIVNALVEKGVAKKDAETIADWFENALYGACTDEQIKILDEQTGVAEAFNDVIINQNSTVNQRLMNFAQLMGNQNYVDYASQFDNTSEEKEPIDVKAIAKTISESSTTESATRYGNSYYYTKTQQIAEESKTAEAIDNALKTFKSVNAAQSVKESIDAVEEKISNENVDNENANTSDESIVSVEDVGLNDAVVKLSNGTKVAFNDYISSEADKDSAIIVDNGMRNGYPAGVINAVINLRKANQGLATIEDWLLGMDEAIHYGYANVDTTKTKVAFSDNLTETEKREAYKLGRTIANEDTTAANEKKKTMTKAKSLKEDLPSAKNKNANQKVQTNMAEMMSYITGNKVVWYGSIVDESGKRVLAEDIDSANRKGTTAPNGFYKNGTIYVDINAGRNGEGLIMWTFAHELTHAVAEKSPTMYKTLSDFLFKTYSQKGIDVQALVADQMRKARRNGYSLTYKGAFEEIVADSMSTMLTDTDLATKLIELRQKDAGLVEALKLEFEKLVLKFKKWVANTKAAPESVEARLVRKMNDAVEELKTKFLDAIVDASEFSDTLEEVEMATDDEAIKPQDAYDGDISPESGDLIFSIREADTIEARSMKYYEANKEKLSHISEDMINEANAVVKEMADYMKPFLDVTNNKGLRYLPEEILGKTTFQNGSYGKTIENTTICFRTLAYIDFTNEVKKRLGRPLTVEESFLASQMIYDIAKEPQCLYCYVSLDRKAYDEFLLKYTEQRDKAMKAYKKADINPNERLKPQAKSKAQRNNEKYKLGNSTLENIYREYLDGREDSPNQRERFNLWIESVNSKEGLISNKDLVTEEARSEIKNQNNLLARQMIDAENYAQGASWAKKLEQYRSYNSDLLSMSPTMVSKLNKHYGLRFYSFSEYTPAFIVENMQQIRDASIKGLYGLAYTKKPDFARIFAGTGMNINISVFGRMDNGKVVMDDLQGANWDEVKQLREEHKNVGAVFVATTDEMVEWALAQDWIDVVIPFHIVRTGANIAEFYKWVNNTKDQADVDASGKNKTISPAEFHNDYDTYMSLIKERGLTPRFDKWKTNPNYMKLVNETRLSDIESTKLQPIFDLEAAEKSFDKFVKDGGYYGNWYSNDKVYESSVNTVVNDILSGKRANEVEYGRQDYDMSVAMKNRAKRNKVHGQKFSARDTEYIDKVNSSISQDRMADVLKRAFNASHMKEWGGYRNVEEWLNSDSSQNIGLVIDSDEQTYAYAMKYASEALKEGDIGWDEVVDAYKENRLIGTGGRKNGSKAIDTSTNYSATDDRFYSNSKIKNVAETLEIAKQRVTSNNRDLVYDARAKTIIALHDPQIMSDIGMSNKDVNELIRKWTTYPTASRELSMKLNNGVAPSNTWAGIENSALINSYKISDEEFGGLVKEVTGAKPSGFEKAYIVQTMLAIDTHTDWSWLSFNFDTIDNINKNVPSTIDVERCAGYYASKEQQVNVSYGRNETVAHEMGHAFDNKLGNDLLGHGEWDGTYLSDVAENRINSIKDSEARQFAINFDEFVTKICERSDITNAYYQSRKEVFARFFAKFVEWTNNRGRPASWGQRESNVYANDKFTATDYTNFVKLLQEKAMLDSKKKGEADSTRYSARDPMAVERANEENEFTAEQKELLDKDASELKKMLSLQGMKTEGRLFTKSSVEAIAKRLMRSQTAKGDKTELVKLLTDAYSYMNAKTVGSETMDAKIYAVADWLIDNHYEKQTLNEDAENISKFVRGRKVYVSPELKNEIARVYGSYGDYVKSLFGTMTFTTTDKTCQSFDSFYKELAATYPGYFETDVSDKDQPVILRDTLSTLKADYTESEYEYYENEIREDLYQSVYEGFWDLTTLHTVADKYSKQINELKGKHKKAMQTLREQRDARMLQLHKQAIADKQEAIAEYRNKATEKQQKLIKHYNERIQDMRDSRDIKEVKKKILNIAKDFRERIDSNEGKKFVPLKMMESIIDICTAIDPTGENQNSQKALKFQSTKQMLLELKDQYDSLKNLDDFDYSSEYSEEFSEQIKTFMDSVKDKPLRNMTKTELEDTYTLLRDIRQSLIDATKQIGTEEAMTNREVGLGIINNMRNVADKKLTTNNVSSVFRNYMTNPMRAVLELSGFDRESMLVELFDSLNEGRRKSDTFRMLAEKEFEKLRATKEGRKNFNDAVEKPFDFGLTDINGKPLKITKMQAMQIILTNEREMNNPNRGHLETGARILDIDELRKGNYDKAYNNGQRTGALTPLVIAEMENKLNDWDRKYMETARTFFNVTAKNAVNEVSLMTKHRLVALEKSYIPYDVDKNDVNKNIEAIITSDTASLNGMSILKSVAPNAKNPLIITGLNSIVDRHIGDVAKLYGLSIPIRNFNKAINVREEYADHNSPTVRTAIADTWGNKELKLVETSVNELVNPQYKFNGLATKIVNTVKSGFVESTLASNLSVWMKQAASYPTAGSVLSTKALLNPKALAVFTKEFSKTEREKIHNEIDAHTSQHYIRRQGLSTQELGEMNQTHGWRSALSNKLGVLSPMNWIQAMDVSTTAALWEASKAQIESQGMSEAKNGEEYWNAATKLYDKVIEETQPMYDSLHRAAITKDPTLKNVIMFQTQPIQNSGILREATMELASMKKQYGKNSKEAKAASKKFAKTVTSQLASHTLFSAMTLVAAMALHKMNPYRDDDDEVTAESTLTEFIKQIGENYFSAIVPVLGSYIISAYEKIFEGSTYDVFSDSVVDKVNTTLDALANLDDPTFDNIVTAVSEIASYWGIPLKNAYNILKGLKLNIEDIANGDFGKFEAGVERTNSQNVNRSYSAYTEGNAGEAKEIIDEMIADKVSEGKTKSEAMSSVKSSVTSKLKPIFLEAYNSKDDATMAQIRKYLKATGLYTDAVETTQTWIKNSK